MAKMDKEIQEENPLTEKHAVETNTSTV